MFKENLSQEVIKRPEDFFEELKNSLEEVANTQNEYLSLIDDDSREDLLNSDCSIKAEEYKYYKEDDDKEVMRREKNWDLNESDINENVIAYYNDKYGISGVDEIINKFKEKNEKRNGVIAEMAITVLLFKALKEKFLVLRTARFDDVVNGIDNVIIDRETGEQICGFDDVNYKEEDKSKTGKIKRGENKGRREEKLEKVKNSITNPKRLKYGIKLTGVGNDQKLKQTCIEKLPIFYLGFSDNDLSELLSDMNFDISSEMSNKEKEIFNIMIKSLKEQKRLIDRQFKNKQDSIPRPVKGRLNNFLKFVEKMEIESRS